MFLYHHFYENSMSGANSYAQLVENLNECFNIIKDDIITHIAMCEPEDRDTIVAQLTSRVSNNTPGILTGSVPGFEYTFTHTEGFKGGWTITIEDQDHDRYSRHITSNVCLLSYLP